MVRHEVQHIDATDIQAIADAARDRRPVAGFTHNFYRYPARFSPQFVASVIERFSQPGDLVLDPYMGGGTTIVEALAAGRRAVGNDLNSLAAFITKVKTTPLSHADQLAVRHWGDHVVPGLTYRAQRGEFIHQLDDVKTKNLSLVRSRFIKKLVACALTTLEELPNDRSIAFARCALLRVSQWALDGRKTHTSLDDFRAKLSTTVSDMLNGLSEWQKAARKHGVLKHLVIANENAACIDQLSIFAKRHVRANLVVTSPPYPGVHILYHRWQVDGRKETPAPYWIAACNDGEGASYYNFSDRRQGADSRYFDTSLRTLKSVRKTMVDGGIIVQMVAFARPTDQLPKYLDNMAKAGFHEFELVLSDQRIWRAVPNRRWYATINGRTNGAKEVVLIHRAA